jgi:predicted site-specific integrase-resolvase
MNAYELAQRLGVAHTTIYRWIKKGLPYTEERKGLSVYKRFNIKEVYEWIETHRK